MDYQSFYWAEQPGVDKPPVSGWNREPLVSIDMITILGLSSWNLLFMKETEIHELGLALVKNFDLRPDVLSWHELEYLKEGTKGLLKKNH